MRNNSQQQNTTSSLKLISSSECIAWLTVYGIEAVATVTLNALTVIVYLKERSLRKRSMYPVINLPIADIFIGGLLILHDWLLGSYCNFWTSDLTFPPQLVTIALFRLFPLASVTNLAAISLERTHATFRPLAHRFVKKKIFGAAVVAAWIIAGLTSTISLFDVLLYYVLEDSHFFLHVILVNLLALSFCYPCRLHVYSCENHLWKSTTSPWCKKQGKKTDQDTVHCDSYISTANAALRYNYFLALFCFVTPSPKQFNMVPVN